MSKSSKACTCFTDPKTGKVRSIPPRKRGKVPSQLKAYSEAKAKADKENKNTFSYNGKTYVKVAAKMGKTKSGENRKGQLMVWKAKGKK